MLILLLDFSVATTARVHVCVRELGKLLKMFQRNVPEGKWLARSREIGTTCHRHWIEQILLAISRGPPLLSARPTLAKCSYPAGVPGSRPHDTRKLIAEKEQFSRLPTSYSSSRAALFSQEGGSVGEVSQGAARHPATNRSLSS